jgi:23S rRNA (uridine2552-2'-O)-methyltransferase
MSVPPRRPGGAGGGARGPSGRGLTQRVQTAGRRRPSSIRWLERQLNDPYVAEAQRQGYRSRAAFKLIQLDDRFHVLGPGKRVIDLGAAPGGWTQVAVERCLPQDTETEGRPGGKTARKGRVVGIDLTEVAPIAGAELLQGDFLAPEAPERLKAALGGPADVVLSDMAAPSTGHARTDHLKIIALAEAALAFAVEVLKPGGCFITKVLQGGATQDLLKALKRDFADVRHVKPAASRADSAEIYVVAQGFRARAAGQG